MEAHKNKLQPGGIVIIKENHIILLQCPLGNTIKVHQSDDGFVRLTDLETLKGTVRRTITRLAVVLINENVGKQNTLADPMNLLIIKGNQPRLAVKSFTRTFLKRKGLPTSVLGAQVHNTKFGRQLGIHFEGIGSPVISSNEWQLSVYYDLKVFWSELTILGKAS